MGQQRSKSERERKQHRTGIASLVIFITLLVVIL